MKFDDETLKEMAYQLRNERVPKTLKDRLAEIVLTIFDLLMNIVTLGTWTRVNGDVVPNVKVKGGK